MPLLLRAQQVVEGVREYSDSVGQDKTLRAESLLAEIHHNIGCIGTETNDPDSSLKHFSAFKDTVLKQASRPGADAEKLRVPIAWNELGNAWMMKKEWKQAEECFRESIRVATRQEQDPCNMSFPMVNLGLARLMLGQYEDASEVLSKGLKAREDRYGKDDDVSFV